MALKLIVTIPNSSSINSTILIKLKRIDVSRQVTSPTAAPTILFSLRFFLLSEKSSAMIFHYFRS